MKLLNTCIILAALFICQFGYSQSPADIQVLQATYGADSAQMDVTEKVQSLVQSGQTNVRVGNHLFGKDPIFGKVKTLSVLFSSNGVQYRTDIREGEQFSLQTANQVDAAALQAPPAPVPAAPRLAPKGTYFLTGSTSVVKDGALIGLHAGTEVQALHDNGKTLHVKWGDSELDVDKRILTNDLNVADAAVAYDQQGQAALATQMNRRQEAINQQVTADQQAALLASARQMEKPKEAFGGWSNNPLDRGAYNNSRNIPWNKETAQLLESLEPPVTNPLDRGAYDKTIKSPPLRTLVSTRSAQPELERERDGIIASMQSTSDKSKYDALHKQLKEVQSEIHGIQFVPPPFHDKPDEVEPTALNGTLSPVSTAEWKAIVEANTHSRKMDIYMLIMSLSTATDQMEAASKELTDLKDRLQARLTRMLLTWYHMELYNSLPPDGFDTTLFKTKRDDLAIQIKRFQAESGNGAIQDSWANLMSVCSALGYPQASLP
jgi:hypothetical protein